MAKIHCLDVLPNLHHSIESWYHTHGRKDLPWRNTSDPYHIYLSEIMLQQTQVQTVLERFYFPFLNRFPSLTYLAKAPREEVTKLWQGLGYYNRAHNLHKAAQKCAPTLPDTIDALIALPGIGKNTAHAIAAFAYHQPVPVMEANLKRVLSRFFALSTPTESILWDHAYQMVNKSQPFNYNQAMMDIGATICTKSKPTCLVCPLNSSCLGKHSPQDFPTTKPKKKVPIRYKNIVVLHDNYTHFYMQPRTTRFLHGLYQFIELDREEMVYTIRNYQQPLNEEHFIGHITQSYSHFTLDAHIYLVENCNFLLDTEQTLIAGTLDALALKPVSMVETKILRLIKDAVVNYSAENTRVL